MGNKRNEGKRKYTVDQMRKALEKAGTLSGAANALECSRETVKKYCDEYTELDGAIDVARDRLLDMAENRLWKNVETGHPSSIFFTLKTLGKNRGFVERTETTGADGVDLFGRMTDDSIDERIAVLEIELAVKLKDE